MGAGSAFDACLGTRLGDEDLCHVVCLELVALVAPAAVVAGGAPEVLAPGSDVSAGVNGRFWDPRADARLVHVAMDACCHHVLLEWRRADGGWRVVQAHVKDGGGRGYAARDWCSAAAVGSGDAGTAHSRWGAGRVLGDEAVRDFWRRLLALRATCETLLDDVLAPQAPGDSRLAAALWARDVLGDAARVGLAALPRGDDVAIVLGGGREVLRVPAHRAAELDAAFLEVAGEETTPATWLRVLNHAASPARGFAVRAFSWSAAEPRAGLSGAPQCGVG